MKKKHIIITAVVLVIAIGCGFLVCNSICNTAIDLWNSGNQVEAMETFSTIHFFPTAAAYIREFEGAMTEQLQECSWRSESVLWINDNRRLYEGENQYANWEYTFYADGKASRVGSHRSSGGKPTFSGPYDVTYSYVYRDGQVFLRISSIDDYDYSMKFITDENGEMRILSFFGMLQFRDDFSTTYTRSVATAVSPDAG